MSSIDYPQYIGASEENKLAQAFDRIAQALVEQRAQFLFGAGMSRDSHLPLGSQLAMVLLRQYFPKTGAGKDLTDERLTQLTAEYPFEAIVHAIEQKPGCKRDDLTRVLKQILLDPNPEPNEAHHVFLSLLGARPRVRTIFTTNYDTLLEKTFGPDLGVAITEKNAADIQQVKDQGKIPIVYLRGKLDGDYQITEPEINPDQFHLLMEEFKVALHTAEAFVFVGCSLNDIDFRQFYLTFLDQLDTRKKSGKTTYFVSPPHDKFSYMLGSEIWDLRKALWIPLGAEGFFKRLKGVLENRTLDRIRSEARMRYEVNDAELDDLVGRTAKLWRMNEQDALLFLYEARTRIGGQK